MKNTIVILFLVFIFMGCGKEDQDRLSKGNMVIQLPYSITNNPVRLRHFMARVSHMEFVIKGRNGGRVQESVPFKRDVPVELPAFNFPEDAKDWFQFEIQIWDKTNDGSLRLTPVMMVEKRVDVEKWDKEWKTGAQLKLRLLVPVTEFDV